MKKTLRASLRSALGPALPAVARRTARSLCSLADAICRRLRSEQQEDGVGDGEEEHRHHPEDETVGEERPGGLILGVMTVLLFAIPYAIFLLF